MCCHLSRLGIALACVLLCACGGSKTEDGSTSSASASSSASNANFFSRDTLAKCAGFGAAQAAAILGVAPDAVVEKSEDITPNSRGCNYAPRDDASKALFFSVNFDESVDEAKTSFAQMRDTLSLGSRVQESATGTKSAEGAYSDILGVGEEAVWSTVNGSLAVRQKNITILVMRPNDKATQVKVAQEVLRVMR